MRSDRDDTVVFPDGMTFVRERTGPARYPIRRVRESDLAWYFADSEGLISGLASLILEPCTYVHDEAAERARHQYLLSSKHRSAVDRHNRVDRLLRQISPYDRGILALAYSPRRWRSNLAPKRGETVTDDRIFDTGYIMRAALSRDVTSRRESVCFVGVALVSPVTLQAFRRAHPSQAEYSTDDLLRYLEGQARQQSALIGKIRDDCEEILTAVLQRCGIGSARTRESRDRELKQIAADLGLESKDDEEYDRAAE